MMIVNDYTGRVATYTISMTNYDWSPSNSLLLRLSLRFNDNAVTGDVDLYIGYNYNNDNNNNDDIYRYDDECIAGGDCIQDRKSVPNARRAGILNRARAHGGRSFIRRVRRVTVRHLAFSFSPPHKRGEVPY